MDANMQYLRSATANTYVACLSLGYYSKSRTHSLYFCWVVLEKAAKRLGLAARSIDSTIIYNISCTRSTSSWRESKSDAPGLSWCVQTLLRISTISTPRACSSECMLEILPRVFSINLRLRLWYGVVLLTKPCRVMLVTPQQSNEEISSNIMQLN